MSPDMAPELEAEVWTPMHTDLQASLGVITGRTQLLRRQVLRADGLIALERDQLLHGLAAILATVDTMQDQLEQQE